MLVAGNHAASGGRGAAVAAVPVGHLALTDNLITLGTQQDGNGVGDQKCKGQDNGQGMGVGQVNDNGQNGQGEGNTDQDCGSSSGTSTSTSGATGTNVGTEELLYYNATTGIPTVSPGRETIVYYNDETQMSADVATLVGPDGSSSLPITVGASNLPAVNNLTALSLTTPPGSPGPGGQYEESLSFTVPSALSPGQYSVTVTVQDSDPANGPFGQNSYTWPSFTVQAHEITQTVPTSGTTLAGTAFTGQLSTTGGEGTVSYVTTTTTPAFSVSSGGVISAPDTLAVGTYTVSGTDSDTSGDSGTWSFTLTVTGSTGTSGGSTSSSGSSTPTPTLSGITPSSGSTKGGTTVTLTGTNLCNASAVDFGTDTGTGVSVNTACTTVTVTDPGQSPGTVLVTVTTSGGTSNGVPFTYTTPIPVTKAAGSPTITGIAPTSGSPSGGESVTLVGSNLCGTTGVLFGTRQGTSVSVNASCTMLSVVDPAGTGTVPVTVETAAGGAVAPIEFTYIESGYWMASSNGSVYSFGGARFFGSLPSIGVTPNSPIVAMADTPDHEGYWLFAADGGVFAFGNAKFFGSVPGVLGPEGRTLNKPIVAAEAMPNGEGYRLFASDGGVFDFGDAAFVGSLPCSAPGSPGGLCIVPNKPIESAVSDPLSQGYWLVGGDGGVFALGGTPFFGSLGAQSISSTIVSMASTPNGEGYWVYGANGSVSPYGDAASYGSMLGKALAAPIAYGAATTSDHGYWLFGRNGGVFAFGSAPFLGSLQSVGAISATPIVTGVGF